ncbi:MAG: hypothetical protein K2X82_25800 [Gemmataceae bacterium]|nr:hypothetical protein [Gemmataceae bacterium]
MGQVVLVQYGRPGFVGRFRSDAAPPRGGRVVVRGPRGVEVGTVLCATTGTDEPDGDLLRTITPEDDAAVVRNEAVGRELLDAAAVAGADLPLAFVDVEVMLDGASAVLHALPWAGCDADPLLATLSDRFGLAVRLLDLSRTPSATDPPEPAGCGKPGCGTTAGGCSSCGTGGGCSSGSCSRGVVKNSEQLTSYFADLRRKMEVTGGGRLPLG